MSYQINLLFLAKICLTFKISLCMKKSLLIISIIISAFVSCTTDVIELDESNNLIPKTQNNSANKITEADALDIAGKIFHKTRSIDDYSIEYVLNDNSPKTRSMALPDTLAYILNFGNDNGFAVIATDNRVYPILAFSESGHFGYEENENDPVYVNFISKISDYMSSVDMNNNNIPIPTDTLQLQPMDKKTLLKTKNWSQRHPYDKYVIIEHPGCPVGCVAVAAGQIMANCKDEFVYHDSIFEFKALIEAMDTINYNSTDYTYDTAVDKIALFLYFLGKDLNMRYSPLASAASSQTAFNLMKRLGYTVNEETYYSSYFDVEKTTQLIDENNLIYVDGRVIGNNSEGHAWVVDGYCLNWEYYYDKPATKKTLFHCDWGWNGDCNGYYLYDLINGQCRNYERLKYFSVKMNI